MDQKLDDAREKLKQEVDFSDEELQKLSN